MTETGQGMANGYIGMALPCMTKAWQKCLGLCCGRSQIWHGFLVQVVEEGRTMIKLTKFNSDGKKGEFILNAEIIETMEETPDTVITLTNGKKLIVQDRMEDIVRKVMVYKRALYK